MGKGKGRGRGRGRGRGSSQKQAESQAAEESSHSNVGATEEQKNVQFEDSTPPENVVVKQVEELKQPVPDTDPSQSAAKPKVQSVETADEKKETLQQPTATPVPQKGRGRGRGVAGGEFSPGQTTILGSSILPSQTSNGKAFQIPKRPGFGTEGRKITVRGNFFPIKFPDIDIHHYDVTISEGPSVDKTPKDINRQLIEKLFATNKKVFGTPPVFDGKKNMYTKNPLPFQGQKDFIVEETENDRMRKFKISLKWANQVSLLSLQNAVEGKGDIMQDAIQGLDLVLRHAASLRYVPVGSKFFTNTGSVNIGYGREVWHGYHQSVRPTRWKLLINMDVSATTFYRDVDVIEYLYDITKYDCTQSRQDLTDADRKKFSKEIKGLKIEITYMGKQRRKYRVNGLTRLSASKQTFPCERDGKEVKVTVQDYFKKEKAVNLRYPWLPCLHVGDVKRNIYIPMEGCKLVKGQQCKKKLNEDLTAAMIKITAQKPHNRMKTIMDKVHDANFRNDPFVKGFGLEVDPNMTKVEARVLPTPVVLYENNKKLTPTAGAWNMKSLRLFRGAPINAWGLVVYSFGRPMRENDILKFQSELMRTASSMGMKIGQPSYQRMANNSDTPEGIVTEAFRKDKNIELLVVILPGKTPFYGDLKRICETENGHTAITDENVKKVLKERGLCTQCIQAKNALKCNPMTLAQLCLKINAKMGGVNNAIDGQNKVTRPMRVFSEPVIFLGADVTHPAAGDRESPSIAAVVGSVDPYPIRYAVSVRIQKHRVEVIEDLESITKELLVQFYKTVKKKPAKIIMFRDGVSEGQFQQVLLYEMTAIQKACTALEKGYQPAITFIVVQKRHHARFFVENLKDADRSGNCPPGTTIDKDVCHPSEFDYYQYSHAGIQGTSRPTHYHILWDDSNFTANEMQSLSFMLCHLYVRCTRSVSIPAPAYYAHHVAFRARYHLQKELGSSASDSSDSGDLSDKMSLLNIKEIVKPHPRLLSMMYFV